MNRIDRLALAFLTILATYALVTLVHAIVQLAIRHFIV